MSRAHDLGCILRSIQLITEAALNLQAENARHVWKTTSLRSIIDDCKTVSLNDWKSPGNPSDVAKDALDRISTVIQGLKTFTDIPSKGEKSND